VGSDGGEEEGGPGTGLAGRLKQQGTGPELQESSNEDSIKIAVTGLSN
jgi:hypothetical protein